MGDDKMLMICGGYLKLVKGRDGEGREGEKSQVY